MATILRVKFRLFGRQIPIAETCGDVDDGDANGQALQWRNRGLENDPGDAARRNDAMIRAGFTRWVQAPPVTGPLALVGVVVAVGIPTAIRAAIDGIVTGCEFTPYLPFVLLSAILMRWWHAGIVALASVAVLGGLFYGPVVDPHGMACFLSGAGIFLASSAMMIGIVVLARRVFASMLVRGADESPGGIVFSLDQGKVWASWYGQGPPVLLGSQRKVSVMMEDFLMQEELGKRLTGRSF